MAVTQADLDDIERKARAAEHSSTTRYFVHPRYPEDVSWSPTIDGRDTCVPQSYADTFRAVDAAYIAATPPPVMLALVDQLRATLADLAAAQAETRSLRLAAGIADARHDILRRLTADTQRRDGTLADVWQLLGLTSASTYEQARDAIAKAVTERDALLAAARQLAPYWRDTSGSMTSIDAVSDGCEAVTCAVEAIDKAAYPARENT